MSPDVPPDPHRVGADATSDPHGTKPVPWHAKLLLAAASIYIALRVMQMVGWLFD